ncbi:hypothetical protein L2E82_29790 [Cichorium intybus]|uniref:Uncharacterized protein n=1 Tax=Cichorium intybus TaxID=13427 RepID=A0ACB9CYU5_CICIN|nr:hypothetical protein L2E82_29790 [Cichorium intybus]
MPLSDDKGFLLALTCGFLLCKVSCWLLPVDICSVRLQLFPEGLSLRANIIAIVSDILSVHNEYVRTFRVASEIAAQGNIPEYAVRLIAML